MELVERLRRSDRDDGSDMESDGDDDVSHDDLDETGMENTSVGNVNNDVRRSMDHERYMLTFKDVKDAIDKFSGDDGKNVN